MTVSTADIPVLHSTEAAHIYPKVVLPICHGVMNLIHLYRGGGQGSTTRLLQSSTSFRKPATVSDKGDIGVPRLKSHRSMIDPRTTLYRSSSTGLAPFR
jgi:hypothetical protein